MRLDMTSRTILSIMLLFSSLGLAGCSTFDRLPFNYMCENPTSNSCNNHCLRQCCNEASVAANGDRAAPVDSLSEPVETLAVQLPEFQDIQERFDELTEENSTMRDQIITLDRQVEEQRKDREELAGLVQSVSTELDSVRHELNEYRLEVDGVADLLNRHHDTNQQVLHTVEQQIDEVLSQYE